MTFKEVNKILINDGWKCIRINGSHHLFQKDGNGPTIPVPYKQELSIGVLKNIEKGTGLSLRR